MNDSVKFRCQKCGVKIEADGSYKGNIAECPKCGNVIMIPAQGVAAGMLIDDFELESPLGSGILGEVWLANQVSMKRPVAIKILSPAIATNPKSMSRFIDDVKNVGKLSHPYIVPALKAGNKGQIYYLAYEYIKGKSIASLIAEGKPLDETEILKYAESIAEALMYAWNKFEILHCDLSPDHVIIDSHGRPKIIDMAISKTIAEDASVTSTGLILGSPPFMSPEIVSGKKDIDSRVDIFSLGAIIYSMATGSMPYENLPPAKLFMMQLKETFPKVKDKNPKASERLARLVEIMTARKKTYRQRSWEDVIFDIRQVMAGKMPETPQPPSLSNNVTDKFESCPKIKCASFHPKRARFGKDSKTRLLEIYRKSPKKQSPVYMGILILIILCAAGAILFFHYKSYTEENQRIESEHRVLEKLLELTAKRKANILHKKGDARILEARKLFKNSMQKATALIKNGVYDEAISILEKAR
ncbi:MAG: protein kinase, partial [Victivallales bacterium]